MWEGKNGKEIRKQAQWAATAGLMANRSTRIKRGKEEVNKSRKLKKWSSKSMRIIRGKEEVNESGKLGKWISKFNRLAWRPISLKSDKR